MLLRACFILLYLLWTLYRVSNKYLMKGLIFTRSTSCAMPGLISVNVYRPVLKYQMLCKALLLWASRAILFISSFQAQAEVPTLHL